MSSIYWHDYETFGADTRRDRPAQFAGVRTDLNLNPIADPDCFYCSPSDDSLPAPEACLITGITPQLAAKEGVVEAEFAQKIHEIFSEPQTCVAGYNSIRFDDEVTRNLFYRNFYDPYEREWRNGNSRWDLIDVVRLTHALRPEGINWPTGNDGQISFRLELLTEANGITHESAHDAVSDVYATIAFAKLIKEKQPKLFEYAFAHRGKHQVSSLLDLNAKKPVFHVSSKFPVSKGCCALVLPLFQQPGNNNAVVCFDLRQNPEVIAALPVDEIKDRLYRTTESLGDRERPALKAIHINKCPVVVSAAVVKQIPEDKRLAWELDLEQIKRHLSWIREHPEWVERLKPLYEASPEVKEQDPDLMLYSGGFFSDKDKKEMFRVRNTPPELLSEEEFYFEDHRLPEMLFRYRARNFLDTLSEEEREQWERYRSQKLLSPQNGEMSLQDYMQRLALLAQNPDCSVRDQHILQELHFYAESIVPYA